MNFKEKRCVYKVGQTTLEFTLCFIVLIMLFVAAFLVFKWAGQNMVKQQLDYEATRGQYDPPIVFSAPLEMNLTTGTKF